MSWFKKKEKEYSPEEAADLVRKEMTPFWYKSKPLLCGAVVEEGGVNPQPLDPSIREGIWVLLFTEPSGASFLRGKDVLREWERRYAALGVRFISVIRTRYSFLRKRRAAETWVTDHEFRNPVFTDTTGYLAQAFGGEDFPRIAILKDGEILFNASGDAWMDGAEKALAEALRIRSPGLPLLPIYEEPLKGFVDAARWPLGKGSKVFDEKKVKLVGKWKQEDDKILTGDPTAELHIMAPGRHVILVAQSFTEELTPTRVLFHSLGSYFPDPQAGADFVFDDEGRSSVVISAPRAYHVLKGISERQREIVFQFPNARVTTVAIYAIEFSESRDQRR